MPRELDLMEDALRGALTALGAAEPEVWRSPAARAYAARLADAQGAARRLLSGVRTARAAVARLEAEQAASRVAAGLLAPEATAPPATHPAVGVPW